MARSGMSLMGSFWEWAAAMGFAQGNFSRQENFRIFSEPWDWPMVLVNWDEKWSVESGWAIVFLQQQGKHLDSFKKE